MSDVDADFYNQRLMQQRVTDAMMEFVAAADNLYMKAFEEGMRYARDYPNAQAPFWPPHTQQQPPRDD